MKNAISIIISCIIILSSVSISVFASNNEFEFSDSNQPIPVGNTLSQAIPCCTALSETVTSYFCASKEQIYAFGYNSHLVFVSKTTNNWFMYWWNIRIGESTPYDSGSLNTTIQYDSDNQLYYMDHTYASSSTYYIPSYDSLNDGLIAFNYYITNGSGSTSYQLNYTLPAGNVAYIEFNNDFDSFKLQTTMPTSSTVIGSDPWPQSNQYYGFQSSVPSGSFTPPSSRITWSRNGRTSIAGITKNAIFDYGPHHPTSGNYLVVYNPAYYGGTDNGPYEFMNNGSITISASNVISITVLQLDSQLTFGQNGVLDVDTTLTGEEYNGEFDEETGDIIWENGSVPVEGGGNLPVSSESQFNSFLSNIIQKIINIFAPAQEAIQTLSSAISGFANYLYALYVWLPAPVLSLLTSAITLAIVIGVIKVFL